MHNAKTRRTTTRMTFASSLVVPTFRSAGSPASHTCFRKPARRRGKRTSRRGVADGRGVRSSQRPRGSHAFRCVSGHGVRRVARDGLLQQARLAGSPTLVRVEPGCVNPTAHRNDSASASIST